MPTIDAETRVWSRFMDTKVSARYLRDVQGLPIEAKTLVNLRALRKGPPVRYFGAKPLYERSELDRWAESDALQPISPLTRNARRRAGLRAAEAGSADGPT
jgi:hypothetical protein